MRALHSFKPNLDCVSFVKQKFCHGLRDTLCLSISVDFYVKFDNYVEGYTRTDTLLYIYRLHNVLQVKITSQTKTMTKRIPSSSEFVKWLRSEESLQSYYLSECELYCLANILGSTINLMTFSSNNRSDAKWESFEPHQGLIHQNKFANNKAPLYCIHELGVQFSRLVKKQ